MYVCMYAYVLSAHMCLCVCTCLLQWCRGIVVYLKFQFTDIEEQKLGVANSLISTYNFVLTFLFSNTSH